MDKASDFGSEDCEFESRRGHCILVRMTPPPTPNCQSLHGIVFVCVGRDFCVHQAETLSREYIILLGIYG